MYTGFAEIYDELMTDVDYEAWAERHEALEDQEDDILDDLDRLKGRG